MAQFPMIAMSSDSSPILHAQNTKPQQGTKHPLRILSAGRQTDKEEPSAGDRLRDQFRPIGFPTASKDMPGVAVDVWEQTQKILLQSFKGGFINL